MTLAIILTAWVVACAICLLWLDGATRDA